GVRGVPRNIKCSKKCAKPDFPGSTSLREPACTAILKLTRFGNPVGRTMTFSPLGSVDSVASNGSTSPLRDPWPPLLEVCAVRADVRMITSAAAERSDRTIKLTLSRTIRGADARSYYVTQYLYSRMH